LLLRAAALCIVYPFTYALGMPLALAAACHDASNHFMFLSPR
jgi:hypothetical protein